jgi:hypothetical protein
MINLVGAFKEKLGKFAPWLLIFLLFYYNFYYWRVAYSFYGNTWRTLFVAMLIWMLYQRYQEHREVPYILIFAVMMAGLASSSSYMFISIDILYLLMAYLFIKKQPRAFGTVFKMALPIVFYVFAFASQYGTAITIAYTALILIIYALIFFVKPAKQDRFDQWSFKYLKIVLLAVIPVFFVLYSVYVWNTNPYYLVNFSSYFENYAEYDMTLDPFGIYGNALQRILIVLKWIGYFLVIRQGWKQRSYLSFTLLFAMIIFLNPLTITAISKIYTMNVYYRAFDIILNPFTIVIYAICIFELIARYKVSRYAVPALSIVCVGLMHLNLFTDIETYTSYNYQLKDGKTVNPILKVKDEDYSVFLYIREKGLVPSDHQITVITHAEGFKTFFPNVYQLYTKNQIYYLDDRKNEDFYQMAKRHFTWEEKEDEDYTQACSFIKEYDVELAVINVYESNEFDEGVSSCMTQVLRTANYSVRTLDQ